MEEKIMQHLRETYDPVAIILHGSRASGHERPHSDWDFSLMHSQGVGLPDDGRSEVLGENIEYSHHEYPVKDVMNEFGIKLQNARVMYEKNTEGTEILEMAQIAYRELSTWTDKQRYNHSLWMKGRVTGMEDTVEQPLLFEKYAADFYHRITNYWYWTVRDSHSLPIYLALEEIKEKDPEYFVCIEKFVHGSREEKVKQAGNIYQKCFGDT